MDASTRNRSSRRRTQGYCTLDMFSWSSPPHINCRLSFEHESSRTSPVVGHQSCDEYLSITATAFRFLIRRLGDTFLSDSSTVPSAATNAMSIWRCIVNVCTSLQGTRSSAPSKESLPARPRSLAASEQAISTFIGSHTSSRRSSNRRGSHTSSRCSSNRRPASPS